MASDLEIENAPVVDTIRFTVHMPPDEEISPFGVMGAKRGHRLTVGHVRRLLSGALSAASIRCDDDATVYRSFEAWAGTHANGRLNKASAERSAADRPLNTAFLKLVRQKRIVYRG
jgi:hypothetical protein